MNICDLTALWAIDGVAGIRAPPGHEDRLQGLYENHIDNFTGETMKHENDYHDGQRPLSSRKEAFAQRVAENIGTLTDAYRIAFDASKMNAATVHKRASELAKVPAVATRIRYFQGEATRAAVDMTAYTLAAAIDEADEIRAEALAAGNHGAATSAATLKAKLAGHLIERKEVRSGPLEDADVQELLRLRKALVEERDREAPAQELAGSSPGPALREQEGNRPALRAAE